MQKLEAIMGKMARNISAPEVLQQLDSLGDILPAYEAMVERRQQSDDWEIAMDSVTGPGGIPGSCFSQAPPAQSNGTHDDIISRGIISLEDAQRYFEKYQNRLDHFLYRILADGTRTLDSVREASPLLTAAVCTVGALHLASKDFDPCYQESRSISATQSFSKTNTVDDVRALCIGAFWLSDLSWALASAAVRIALELQLHKSFLKLGDRQHYLRARLYFLVYACDHHFSVFYGRPPMTTECEAARGVRKLLDCEYATEDDARLVSQVLRWNISSQVFHTFGVDVDKPLSDSEIPHVRRLSIAMDSLRAEWADRFIHNMHVGNYPRKGVGMQYHFAKLYLYSHAFRGAGSGGDPINSRSHDAAMDLEEIANTAVLSALSILRAVVVDTEIQTFLDGLPTYFDIMIAFAVVFLLKVSIKFSASVRLDVEETKRLVGELVVILKRVTSTMHPRHLLVSITKGIDNLLQRCFPTEDSAPAVPAVAPQHGQEQILADPEILNGPFNWTDDMFDFDPCFMGEYDFLSSQDMNINLDFMLDNMPPQQ